jgi:hypothetical protein
MSLHPVVEILPPLLCVLLHEPLYLSGSEIKLNVFFYVLLTVHHSITLDNDQLNAQIF